MRTIKILMSTLKLILPYYNNLKKAIPPIRNPINTNFSIFIQYQKSEGNQPENAVSTSTQHHQLSRGEPTIFDKIISKEMPAKIFYEDSQCLAFHHSPPEAPVHFLVIPKYRIPMLECSTEQDTKMLGHLMRVAGQLGKENAPNGFRLIVNNGEDGRQSVYHLHLHVLGGRPLNYFNAASNNMLE